MAYCSGGGLGLGLHAFCCGACGVLDSLDVYGLSAGSNKTARYLFVDFQWGREGVHMVLFGTSCCGSFCMLAVWCG
jgi:hypothetical protein